MSTASVVTPAFVYQVLKMVGLVELRWPIEWFASRTPNHKIVGSSPPKSVASSKTVPRGLRRGDDNGASVHSAVKEYLAIDRDGNCP